MPPQHFLVLSILKVQTISKLGIEWNTEKAVINLCVHGKLRFSLSRTTSCRPSTMTLSKGWLGLPPVVDNDPKLIAKSYLLHIPPTPPTLTLPPNLHIRVGTQAKRQEDKRQRNIKSVITTRSDDSLPLFAFPGSATKTCFDYAQRYNCRWLKETNKGFEELKEGWRCKENKRSRRNLSCHTRRRKLSDNLSSNGKEIKL